MAWARYLKFQWNNSFSVELYAEEVLLKSRSPAFDRQ